MADKSFMYWIGQLYGSDTNILKQEKARYALVGLLLQEEIDYRLQQCVEEQVLLNGWAYSSSCAAIEQGPRTTAPGLSFHERIVQRLQQRERRGGRSVKAHAASLLIERLKSRDQAALLLTGYQLKAPRQSQEDDISYIMADMDTLPPREISLQGIWTLQMALSGWLDIALDKPFPSAQALQRAGVRAKARLMKAMEDVLLTAGVMIA